MISCGYTKIHFILDITLLLNNIHPLLEHFSEHAERNGFGVVECFVGHGVGRVFHSEPIIYHQRKSCFSAIDDRQCIL
jgi:methionine aminopeptidase